VELTGNPYSFEILQIESVALFFVVMSAAVATWNAFRDGGSTLVDNREMWAFMGVGLFLALTGAFVFAMGPSQFLFAIELAFGAVLAAMRPANALAYFICLQFLRPWEVAEETPLLLALPRMTGMLVLASAFASYFRGGARRIRIGYGQYALIGFASWALLTTFFTPTPGELQSQFFDGFFRAIIIFFLIVSVVRTKGDVNLVRQVYLWSVTGLACVSIYVSWDDIFGTIATSGGERLHAVGTLENSNDIAAVLIPGIPFALRRLAEGKRDPIIWIESLFFLGVTLVALYLAQSRGALLALGVGGIGWWILRSKKRWTVILVGLAIAGAVTPFANELLRRDEADLHGSSESRMTYWKAGLRMVIRSPVYGVGWNRYPKEYQQNAGDGEQFEFGERTAHSTWILALAETGIPGFLLFVTFVFSVVRMGIRIVPTEPDLFVALVAYLVAITFLSHTYLIYPYILFGLVVAAYRIRFRSDKSWRI
jgi:hypothetical protein